MARIDRWLVHTCTIEKPVDGSSDPFGRPEESMSTLSANEPCRFQNVAPRSGPTKRSSKIHDQAVEADYLLFLGDELDGLDERVIVTNIRDEDGRVITSGPLDTVLLVERYGRRGVRDHTTLYLSRRGI